MSQCPIELEHGMVRIKKDYAQNDKREPHTRWELPLASTTTTKRIENRSLQIGRLKCEADTHADGLLVIIP
ncbi:MAG: hypothetical protein ACI9R3_006084 [Verrucomicrobiales bacterium]|jgi:hypothetical protein